MALKVADRVKETTSTAGTVSLVLAGAESGFQTFLLGIGNGLETYYTIEHEATGDWETGRGTFTSGPDTLSRDTVLDSSNAGAKVVFAGGTKKVFVVNPSLLVGLLFQTITPASAGKADFVELDSATTPTVQAVGTSADVPLAVKSKGTSSVNINTGASVSPTGLVTGTGFTATTAAANPGGASTFWSFTGDVPKFGAATLSAVGHTHAATDVVSGTFADVRIAPSNVTQHEAALTILESQITDGAILARVGSAETITAIWAFNGGTSGASAPFTVDSTFLVTNLNADLLDGNEASAFALVAHVHAAGDITSGTFTDARIAESNVTQHEAAIDHDVLTNYVVGQHRIINDAGTSATELWSASKIDTELSGKIGGALTVNTIPKASAATTVVDSNITDNGTTVSIGSDMLVTGNLVVQGSSSVVESETVLVSDNHLYLNAGYTTVAAQTGGLAVNYLPTATTDTVAGAGFVAGIPATSNPTVATTGAATFSVGDLIQISGANDGENDGLYEVLTHAVNVLTIRGIGLTARVEDFTQNQFKADSTVAGTITKVTVSVIRSGTDGIWETAAGAVTGLTFTDLSSGGHTHAAADVVSGTFADARIAASNVTQHEAAIDHDALLNFVAGEHVLHSGVVLTAGAGLSGGGDISISRTFNVDISPETVEASPAATDLFLMERISDGALRKVEFQNLGSPGGSNTQVQFNNSGAFGGEADFTYDSTGNRLSVTGGIRTGLGSASAPVYSFTASTNTGMYLDGSNRLNFAQGGAAFIRMNTSGGSRVEMFPVRPLNAGSAANVTYSVHTGAQTTGWYGSSGIIRASLGGVLRFTLANGQLTTTHSAWTSTHTLNALGASTPSNPPTFTIRAGTGATPSATIFGRFKAMGHDGTSININNPSMDFKAAELFTGTAHGSQIEWRVIALGSVSPQIRMTLGSEGDLILAPNASPALAASTERPDADFRLNRIVTFATGAITDQRAFKIAAPTYAFAGASTITNAASFYISGAPIAGTNATITNPYALWIDSGIPRLDSAVALGGGAAPTLGTIGGSGPATAAQNEWIEIHTQNGTRFVPAWA